MIRLTFSRYTLPDQTEPVYDVLVGASASGFNPRPDRAAAVAYLEKVTREHNGRVHLTVWDGDAGQEYDTVEELT